MSLFLFILFIILFRKNKKDRKRSDVFRAIFYSFLALTVLSIFVSSPVLWLIAIALITAVAVQKKVDRQNDTTGTSGTQNGRQNGTQYGKQNSTQYGTQNSTQYGTQSGTQRRAEQTYRAGAGFAQSSSDSRSKPGYTESRILPRPINRRIRIVSAFNDKYDLSLTKDEIKRIVEASYVSEAWKREVEAMTAKYETEGQWFYGATDWLRVYIYVFEIQNISSDFTLQEQICFETLDEVMAYACEVPAATIEERAERINRRYFTRFDEMSFMIAYRYLQHKGRNYELSRPDLVKNVDQELEETMEKYRRAGESVSRS